MLPLNPKDTRLLLAQGHPNVSASVAQIMKVCVHGSKNEEKLKNRFLFLFRTVNRLFQGRQKEEV
jgi:hypothetical protein